MNTEGPEGASSRRATTRGDRLIGGLRRRTAAEVDFEQLFDQEAGALLAFLTLRTGNRALAEDVLADAFERVFRKQHSFNPRRGTQKSWLYSIALNLLTDQIRRGQAEQRAVDRVETAGAPDHFREVDDRDLLERAASGLSADEREAVALRFGAELTMPEIAELIKEPLSTVEGRIYRALRKLRDEISEPSVGIDPARSYKG